MSKKNKRKRGVKKKEYWYHHPFIRTRAHLDLGCMTCFSLDLVDSQNWQIQKLTSLADRSNRSTPVIRVVRSVIGFFCKSTHEGVHLPRPIYNGSCQSRLTTIDSIQLVIYFLPPNPSFCNSICCSSYVSTVFEGVLSSQPISRQP